MAEIRWIFAPIGGGKSGFSVREGAHEFRRSNRHWVFSLPILLDERYRPDLRYSTLQEWADLHINRPVDVRKRILFLTMEQQREFFRMVPADGVTPETVESWNVKQAAKYADYKFPDAFLKWRNESFKAGQMGDDWMRLEYVVNDIEGLGLTYGLRLPWRPHPLYGVVTDFGFRTDKANGFHYDRGCFYQLDECHKSFPARYWQMLGPQVEDYVSEVRKLNDDLDLITQHPEKVDKNMRRNATEWVQVVNMERNRLFMGVTINKRFRWFRYPQVDMPSPKDKYESSGWFARGEKEKWEFLYLTMWGQSVRGAGTSETNKRKGLHPVVWLLALVAMFAAGHYFPLMIETAIAKGVGGTLKGVQSGMKRGLASSMPVVQADNLAPSREVKSSERERLPVASGEPVSLPVVPPGHGIPPLHSQSGVYCTGWASMGGTNDMRIFLSDGRVAYADRGEIQAMGARFVRVFGEAPIPVR